MATVSASRILCFVKQLPLHARPLQESKSLQWRRLRAPAWSASCRALVSLHSIADVGMNCAKITNDCNKRWASGTSKSSNSSKNRSVITDVKPTSIQAVGKGVVDGSKWCAQFILPERVPAFVWKPPLNGDPATDSDTCCDLLVNDTFIDKSGALYPLLKHYFNDTKNDFKSTPLLLAYPRRFAKTTLLGFIEAIYSPLSELDDYDAAKVKTKIASLERGKDLLKFGLHPVLTLNLQWVSSIESFNVHLQLQFKRAGLDSFSVNETLTPVDRLIAGVAQLNEKFQAETGVKTKTIVLIDEYDKPFRDRERDMDDPLLQALIRLFSVSKKDNSETGISLFILCGLTRMVGTGLSSLNNLVDVSRQTIYHGLCGISSRELVRCANKQLDKLAMKSYEGQTFQDILNKRFRLDWNGFRFGLDEKIGELDPDSSDGALFSPMDVWEIVRSLIDGNNKPSSRWIATMHSEFGFTSFADKYLKSTEGSSGLYLNLQGGWMDKTTLMKQMDRNDYITLGNDTDVKKVLFELGLLSVKEIDGNVIRLGYPNWTVTQSAMELLVKRVMPGITPKELAEEYLSKDGFESILVKAANAVVNIYCATGTTVIREYPLQDFLYMQLLICFPDDGNCRDYKLFTESLVLKAKGFRATTSGPARTGKGFVDIAVVLTYDDGPKVAYLIEVKLAKLDIEDPESIKMEHQKNIVKATRQVKCYTWKGAEVNLVRRVAVSGVWYPTKEDGRCMLSHSFAFVEPIETDHV